MRLSKFLLSATGFLLLAGCQTVDGFVQDVNSAFATSRSSASASSASPAPVIDDKCPRIEIVDELSSFSEFTSDTMSQSNLVSRVDLNQVESSCSIKSGQVTLDLKLAFNGTLGPKAKLRNNDKPFFSYPFFIAVTNDKGVILAKEVFAASMTYERNENEHTYYENLRQIIPITSYAEAKQFTVMIGFQLTNEQLKYNRKYMVPVDTSLAPTHNETTAAAQNISAAGN